jgi:hypothetical protein
MASQHEHFMAIVQDDTASEGLLPTGGGLRLFNRQLSVDDAQRKIVPLLREHDSVDGSPSGCSESSGRSRLPQSQSQGVDQRYAAHWETLAISDVAWASESQVDMIASC